MPKKEDIADVIEVEEVVEKTKEKPQAKKAEKVEEEEVEEAVESEVDADDDSEDLSKKTLSSLKGMAKEAGIKGYSTMKKDELISLLSE